MKHLNFAVTHMKRNQVINLIVNYRFLFTHLMNKIGTKRHAKPKIRKIPPARIKLPPQIIEQLQPIPTENVPYRHHEHEKYNPYQYLVNPNLP